MNRIIRDDNNIHVKIDNSYYVPLWALRRPKKLYAANQGDICLRRMLTDIVKMGIGKHVDVTRISAESLMAELEKDGVLRMDFNSAYEKRCYKLNLQYPSPYSESGLETDYKSDTSLWRDLTFWAVQFLYLYNSDMA